MARSERAQRLELGLDTMRRVQTHHHEPLVRVEDSSDVQLALLLGGRDVYAVFVSQDYPPLGAVDQLRQVPTNVSSLDTLA